MTFKVFRFECLCGEGVESLQWDYEPPPPCPQGCGAMLPERDTTEHAPSVIGDDIPGGMLLEHVAFKDGRPQRFYSKDAMREAARRAGWTRYGETPKASKHREV